MRQWCVLSGEPRLEDSTVLSDGRELWFAEWGATDGPAVILLHGGPGSRLLNIDLDAVERRGVRLVTVDRPGLGRSTRLPLHGLRSVAEDLLQLAHTIGLRRFAVAGFSAGGTYALALGTLAPQGLTAIATMSTPAGPEVPNGFVRSDAGRAFVAELASTDRAAAVELTAAFFAPYVEEPDSFLNPADTPDADMFLLRDERLRREFVDRAIREGLRQGPDGAGDDTVAHLGPWDVDVAQVQVPVFVFHGREDIFVPLADAEHLVSRLPTSHLTIWARAGHVAALRHFGEVLDHLTSTL